MRRPFMYGTITYIDGSQRGYGTSHLCNYSSPMDALGFISGILIAADGYQQSAELISLLRQDRTPLTLTEVSDLQPPVMTCHPTVNMSTTWLRGSSILRDLERLDDVRCMQYRSIHQEF